MRKSVVNTILFRQSGCRPSRLLNLLIISLSAILSSCNDNGNLFIVSGYSAEGSSDVMLCSMHAKGSVSVLTETVIGHNPSFFATGPDGLLWFVNEVDSFNLRAGGGITTLRYDSDEKSLTELGSISQGAAGPCHVTLSNDGRYLITANYGSGSISVVRLNKEGIPQEVTDIIYYGNRSHPHMTIYNRRTQVYYISDLGLDRIHQLKLDTAIGRLINADIPYIRCEAGSGPRHMAIDKRCSNLYVINELSSTVSVFDVLADTARIKQTVSSLPEGFTGKNFCADIHLTGNGKRLYGSNRGHNSIVSFRVNNDGTLSAPDYSDCGGNWPRNFALSPAGKFFLVANQRSDRVSVLHAGRKASDEIISSVAFRTPACIKFIN